ncbi:putative cytoplasmic protein [Escherichia coli]|nr:putative cytoplasmic protein [Escherichia coli]
MDEVVKERYNPAQWNIYAAQASDGDNWADDSPLCHEILANKLLPVVRYYSYIEITRRAHQTLWREYEHLQSTSTTLRCSISATRMIFIRCSVNCFINKNATAKD